MENQPVARLSFTCDRNWEDMVPVKDGRFCNDCQKKVVDFTNKTNDEIAAYLISSTTKVCGRFTESQLAPALPKPLWKRWLSAAAMFAAVFIGIKEASAQTKAVQDTTNRINQYKSNNSTIGEVTVKSFVPNGVLRKQSSRPKQTVIIDPVEQTASFPGGEKAFQSYLNKNLRTLKGVQGRVIMAFVIEKDGSLTDIKVLRGLNKEADKEAVRLLKASPKWKPGIQNGIIIKTAYTIPINF